MNEKLRNDIAAIAAGISPASFGSFLWLFMHYLSSRPAEPHPESGFIYRLTSHGAHFYVTQSETAGLTLLMLTFLISTALMVIFITKQPLLPPPGMPGWRTFLSARSKTAFSSPTPRIKILFLLSALMTLAIIYFAGKETVAFLLSHGISPTL